LSGGVSTAYRSTGSQPQWQWAYHIYRYLALPAPTSTRALARTLICPGFQASQMVGDISTNICYVDTQVVKSLPDVDGNGQWSTGRGPFGYEDKAPPLKVTAVPGLSGLPLSSVWMLADVDQVVIPISSGNGWASQLPIKPTHVGVRNFVYFDGHVGAKHVGLPGWFYNNKYGPEN